MTDLTYFQYFKDLDYPIYLGVHLGDFDADTVVNFLEAMNFQEVEDKIVEENREKYGFRLLKIARAKKRVMKQIGSFMESDRFAGEKIIPGTGHQIYRFQGHALLVYSLRAKEWEMGMIKDFGADEFQTIHRMIIQRFLSWSLAPLGICGFWAMAVDEGAVVLTPYQSLGEAVFIDLREDKVLTLDGAKELDSDFSFVRLDTTLKGRSKEMSIEELFGFLTVHCSYFSYEGLSVPVRQMIQTLAKNILGVVIPESHFVPRAGQKTL